MITVIEIENTYNMLLDFLKGQLKLNSDRNYKSGLEDSIREAIKNMCLQVSPDYELDYSTGGEGDKDGSFKIGTLNISDMSIDIWDDFYGQTMMGILKDDEHYELCFGQYDTDIMPRAVYEVFRVKLDKAFQEIENER